MLAYLYSLETHEVKLGLERIQSLLDRIGNPEKRLKCIHVAGTNGKGSVCAMIQSILMEAGYKVGMYTSPHLRNFNERIRINNHFITDVEVVDYFLKIKPYMADQSFFEVTTAMAFLYFKERKVDYAVMEVGLGGRLDATNVLNPLISIITNISLEHVEFLGNSIEKIAYEKAGIIKQNIPVVTGAKGKALKVIRKIANERNAPLTLPEKFNDVNFKNLNGSFQQQNKDIAMTAIYILKYSGSIKLNENQIKNGIMNAKWPGRLDFIAKNVLIDSAHNPGGFRVLKKELMIFKIQRKIQNVIFVVGFQNDKDIDEIFKIIGPLASSIIFTKSGNTKAAKTKDLLRTFDKINKNHKINKKIINNPKNAMDYAKKIAEQNDLVVVTGSIYMIGEML